MASKVDWADQTRKDVLTFQMVSPTNIDQVYGELEGVELSGSSLTAAYYTDTRTSGRLVVHDGNWVRGSMIRVIHSVPEWWYRKEIGTYIVTDDGATREKGHWTYELTLHSRLFGLSTDKHARPWTIAKNASALKAIRQTLKASGTPYKEKSPKDKKYKDAVVVESGTTRLKALFDICEVAGNRLDVDTHGRVTISPMVKPSSKTAVWRIDLKDSRGIATDNLSRTTDWLQMADVVAVSHKFSDKVQEPDGYYKTNGTKSDGTPYKKGDPKYKEKSVEREVTGIAKVSASTHQAHAKRGYSVVNFISVSEMSPKTAAQAQKLAQQYLKDDQHELVEWELTTMYRPVWEGDVVELVVHDGLKAYQGVRKCFVKSLDLNLKDMTMRLTLKETASGDKGDTK